MSVAREWSIPPGYRVLADVLQEYGRDLAQTNLLSGQWPAFKLNLKAGDLESIPMTTWGVGRGRTWLEKAVSGESEWVGPQPGGTSIRYAVIVRVTEQQPPGADNPRDEDGPAVRLAKELMAAVFPQGEWRQMKIKAVQKGCEQEAKTRGVPLPSVDSFSWAMGRRRKKRK